MVGTIVEKSETVAQPSVSAVRSSPVIRPSSLKYYIHDGIDACRFQLLGEVTASDVPELRGCWRTAKTTLAKRKLILDLRALKRMDEAGSAWVTSMVAEGAECIRSKSGAAQGGSRVRPRKFARLLAIFRSFRLSSDSSTQAQ